MGIVKLLAEGNQIPEEYNPHSLKGNWKNYMECHIENDTLLIWFDKNNNAIVEKDISKSLRNVVLYSLM